MKRAISLAALWAASAMAATPEPGSDQILAALSHCDARFFEALHTQADTLGTRPDALKGSTAAYFKVADRTNTQHNLRRFTPPIKLGRFEAVAYFDEHMNLSGNEVFMSWGFLLRAPVADVVKGTQAGIWDSARLLQDGPTHSRTEWWDPANKVEGWQKVVTPGSAEPQAGTVERTLQIEPFDKDTALTRFGCTLQGAVTPELLQAARPDIDPGGKARSAKK